MVDFQMASLSLTTSVIPQVRLPNYFCASISLLFWLVSWFFVPLKGNGTEADCLVCICFH